MSNKTKYVFRRRSDDKRVTRMFSMAQFEKCREVGTRFRLPNGDEVTLIESGFDRLASVSANSPPPRKCSAWSQPQISTSLKVHPMQVAHFNERARVNGTGARYLKDGTCELASRAIRKRETAARGGFDEDAGYGDQAPQNL